MSLVASQLVWNCSQQQGNALLVMLALADRANDELTCWPGVDDIARRCRLKRRAVQQILADIERSGELSREFRRGTGLLATTVYRLRVSPMHGDARVQDGARVHGDAQTGASPCADGCTVVREQVHGHASKPSENRNEPSEEPSLVPDAAVAAPAPRASKRKRAPSQHTSQEALTIYGAYPRRVARAHALRAIANALEKHSAEHLLERTKAFAAAVAFWPEADRQFVPYPATWYNRESFDDDPATWRRNTSSRTSEFAHAW